jgi:hypothetical protein
MASWRLAPSLRNLFNEIDAVWPDRKHGLDGSIGDAAHQATQSDHNPDSRGIVHAIDIDNRGIDPYHVVSQVIQDELPTSYVVYNRQIWSRTRQFVPRPYTGDNPHTDHIHVSIRYGEHWESANWTWGIAAGGFGSYLGSISVADDMSNWEFVFQDASDAFASHGDAVGGMSDVMRYLMSGGR